MSSISVHFSFLKGRSMKDPTVLEETLQGILFGALNDDRLARTAMGKLLQPLCEPNSPAIETEMTFSRTWCRWTVWVDRVAGVLEADAIAHWVERVRERRRAAFVRMAGRMPVPPRRSANKKLFFIYHGRLAAAEAARRRTADSFEVSSNNPGDVRHVGVEGLSTTERKSIGTFLTRGRCGCPLCSSSPFVVAGRGVPSAAQVVDQVRYSLGLTLSYPMIFVHDERGRLRVQMSVDTDVSGTLPAPRLAAFRRHIAGLEKKGANHFTSVVAARLAFRNWFSNAG